MGKEHNIAIVNSSTFGVRHNDLLNKLESLGRVKRFEFEPDISGRELASGLDGEDFVIASVTPDFSEGFFYKNDDVKLITRHGIGYDNVDIEAATRAGVPVTRVRGDHERNGVAELAIGLAFDCLRQIGQASEAVEDGRWDERREYVGREISRAKVGLIGYGNIGSRVAEILRGGFQAEVMAYDPNVAGAVIEKNSVKPVNLEELLRTADLISLNASLNESSRQMIGRKEFEIMKDEVVIINTARGQLIDERALARALDLGQVRAVGLDVTNSEPIEPDNPLLGRDNVVIVPHIGGYSDYSLRKMDEKMVKDIEAALSGRVPELVVNSGVFRKSNRLGIKDGLSSGC
ncbi:MAG: D-isomer specific 2-hydroxyacid dehydrogenase family protein [Candidatus Bipolaricaulia bacterium]